MASSKAPEPFTMLGSAHRDNVYGDFEEEFSAKTVDVDAVLTASLRHHYPGMTLTTVLASNINLIRFAYEGHATAELDTSDDPVLRWRYYQPPRAEGDSGSVLEARFFAKYKFTWKKLPFTVYVVSFGYITLQYVLFPPDDDENVMSNSKAASALLLAAGATQFFPFKKGIYIFDNGYWTKSVALYEQVLKASWDDVILDDKMKKEMTGTVVRFFDSESYYHELGVPWKRGLIFYGPAGNGKTISLKALMHSVSSRQKPILALYVKSMTQTWHIRMIFSFARSVAPALLILEDIDSLVNENLRSYFFNEVDGLENNNGIMMIGTTNHLDQLDPGLAKRPSRFDRKYLFPLPSHEERVMYCDYWRNKLKDNKRIEFPAKLSSAIADITEGFSFAYLQEAFVASLLAIARREEDEKPTEEGGDHDYDDIKDLILWKEMQKEVKILRGDMDSSDDVGTSSMGGNPRSAHLPQHFVSPPDWVPAKDRITSDIPSQICSSCERRRPDQTLESVAQKMQRMELSRFIPNLPIAAAPSAPNHFVDDVYFQ